MNNNINKLVKQYVLWPELNNDFQKNIDFSKTTMAQFAQEVFPIINDSSPIESEIALFYLLNEKLSQSRKDSQDVLGKKELADFSFYQKTMNRLSKSLLSYIVTACMVEGRHCRMFNLLPYHWHNSFDYNIKEEDRISSTIGIANFLDFIRNRPTGRKFLKNFINEQYSTHYKNTKEMDRFLDFTYGLKVEIQPVLDMGERGEAYGIIIGKNHLELDNFTIEEVLNNLKVLFTADEFSSSFGGKPWADIAAHGLKFVRGEINAEMFIDQAFSLEHNNGNMFNKEFLFTQKETLKYYFYDESKKTPKSHNVDIPSTSFLLNAQHLGTLSGLFSIEQTLKHFLSVTPEELFSLVRKELKHSHYNVNVNNYDQKKFAFHYKAASKFYRQINKIIDPIKKDLVKKYPEYYKNIQFNPIDFKKLMHEVTVRNLNYSNLPVLVAATSETGDFQYFDFINLLHNVVFNPISKQVANKPFAFNLYDINELPKELNNKSIIGGKAWSLANMTNLGLPVPKAKVFPTECCASYYQHNDLFMEHLNNNISSFNNYLKDVEGNPILCSVRSGSPVSMPGMMDTVLNVGIDDSNYDYFCEKLGKSVTDKCVNKFMQLFCAARLDKKVIFDGSLEKNLDDFRFILFTDNIQTSAHEMKFPLTKTEQIKESLIGVFNSWNSERAKAYRTEKSISHDLGTAAIVQQMVFGNLNDNSCTGVVFSRNCLTGENTLVGEFLPKAQGEDVVSGSVTPFPIDKFKAFNKEAYEQLAQIAKKLEAQTGQIQDIEFTVEDGKLYILQHRQAVCSPIAALEILKDKAINRNSLLKLIDPKLLQKSFEVVTQEEPLVKGLSANSGVLHGMVIKCKEDLELYKNQFVEESKKTKNLGWIFYADLTSPEHMPIMNKTQGFITEQGGFTSHAAIIARSLNKPCIVGLGYKEASRFNSGDIITIDGNNGNIWQGIMPLVANDKLAKAAAKVLMKSHNIDISEINEDEFMERVNHINQQHKSWVFNLPNVKEVKNKPVKVDKFFNLSQKVAMIIAANQKNPLDLQLEEMVTNSKLKKKK